MCGIVGAINGGTVINELLSGLHSVEYRGYDSSGVAILTDNTIVRRRSEGKLAQLKHLLSKSPLDGAAGIAHTRWATHGAPSTQNAHPHATEDVAVVHNGIIENFAELRADLVKDGHIFESETDSEVIPQLITYYLNKGHSRKSAIYTAINCLTGSFAAGILLKDDPDHIYAVRMGSPLVVGLAKHGAYLASDASALSKNVQEMTILKDGEVACLGREKISISDFSGQSIKRAAVKFQRNSRETSKAEFPHYMLKEIHEQPDAIDKTLRFNAEASCRGDLDFASMSRLTIIACGTSYYAASVAKYWFEKYANLAVETDIASEFRYRSPYLPADGTTLCISQSGETADTLAALNYAKSQKQQIIALVNSENSSIAREADFVFVTQAGVEIGVASTKAFTTQLATLAQMVIRAGLQRGALNHETAFDLIQELCEIPIRMREQLQHSQDIRAVVSHLKKSQCALFIGRGTLFPIAMEGALKLKEISYIHAEGFGAGELKHGPIALIEPNTPVIALTSDDDLFEKTVSNIHEVAARGARVITVGPKPLESDSYLHIKTVDVSNFTAPILYTLPMQLIAYHTAVALGTDVDQPRNLAKSVTVE